jgi:hypothetical protein
VANSYKALAIAAELADKLKTRLPATQLVTQSFDTDGNPLISINDGTAATLEANFVIKIAAVDWPLALDVLGLAQTVFTPHVIAIATEADTTAGAAADPMTRAQLLPVIGQALAMGCETRWYESAVGAVPTAATITAGAATGAAFGTTNLKATYQPDHYHGLVSNQ